MWVKKSMKSKYSIYILLHIAIIVMWSFFYKFNLITNDAVEINALSIENAVVLLSYPEKAFGNPKALRAFLSTDVSLSLDETLSYYVCR